jgi:hypothetical protein
LEANKAKQENRGANGLTGKKKQGKKNQFLALRKRVAIGRRKFFFLIEWPAY